MCDIDIGTFTVDKTRLYFDYLYDGTSAMPDTYKRVGDRELSDAIRHYVSDTFATDHVKPAITEKVLHSARSSTAVFAVDFVTKFPSKTEWNKYKLMRPSMTEYSWKRTYPFTSASY